MIRNILDKARPYLGILPIVLLLSGCKFEARTNILANEPTIPIGTIIHDLGGAYFQETTNKNRSARVGLTDEGRGELVLYKNGVEEETIIFQAVYGVPGPTGAFLVAEINPSGITRYYLFRPTSRGEIKFIGNSRSAYDYEDPKVLLYWANLYAIGIPQLFEIIDFGNESGTFRIVSQEEFEKPINDRMAAAELRREEERRKAETERLKAEEERIAREAVARAFAPNEEDVIEAYNRISRTQVATMSALSSECERAGENAFSATACLIGGAGQIDVSEYTMNVISADIRDCTSISADVPAAICEVNPVFRAASNGNSLMKLVAGLSSVSGYRFVRFERINGDWLLSRTYDSCSKTSDGFNCKWTE